MQSLEGAGSWLHRGFIDRFSTSISDNPFWSVNRFRRKTS
jgi:hypothetical protein